MTEKRFLARMFAYALFSLGKNTHFILKILLYTQLFLQIATAGAASITDTHFLDHLVGEKPKQILHSQVVCENQLVMLTKAGVESESSPISSRPAETASILADFSPKKISLQGTHAWVHFSLPFMSMRFIPRLLRLLRWGEKVVYAEIRSSQQVWTAEATDKSKFNLSHIAHRPEDIDDQAFSVQKNALGSLNLSALAMLTAKLTLSQIKIRSGASVSDTYLFAGASKASDLTAMFQYKLVSQPSLARVSEWGLTSFPLYKNIPKNKLRADPLFSLLMSLVQGAIAEEPVVGSQRVGLGKKKPTPSVQRKAHTMSNSHLLTDKEVQDFQKKLKTKSAGNSLPRSRNTSNPLLRQQVNEKPPVSISDLPYIGPVAAPLAQWAQSRSLPNVSLTSQQLGLSGPVSGGVTYSNVTGVFLNAQYVLPLADQVALGMLGEYGPGQYRLNGTVAYGFSPLSQIKVSGEYLVQRLPFQFDSGNVMQRLHQSAYGVRFQQLFEQPYWQKINLGGYYASAANKNLPPVIFSANGESYLNERRIAGASSSGIDVGTEILLSRKTLLGGNVYFDRVRYGTQLTGDTSQNRQGLGGGIKLKQLFGGSFKLWGEVSVRKIYDTYEGGVGWLPLPKLLGLELSVLGQHVVFHNSMPNNSNINLQVKWMPDVNPHYDEYFDWKNKHLPTVSQWAKTPAVYMPQVLAIAEQITTRLLLLTITSINPNNGPAAGGNTVTITGSHFVNGLMVFFGGQLGSAIVLLSSTTLTVTVPSIAGSSAPQAVDVVIENPDGEQAILSNGYTYNGLPSITSIVPPLGPIVGGTLVTITGTDLTGATSVTFGGVSGTNVVVDGSGTQLTVVTPAGVAGTVDVVVTTPNGSVTATGGYTYLASPTVTSISPASGPLGGGVPVTISGTGFVNGQTTVTFGGNDATVTSVNPSGTQMTVITPAGTAGAVDVVVTTPGGSVTQAGGYTYVNQPNISSLSPAFGPLAGGTQVTITGEDLTGATSVTFGGVPGTNISVNGDGTQLFVTAPAGVVGAVDVVVTTPVGSSQVNPPATTYTYVAIPTITGISPSSGPLGGGVPVTISGTGFVNGQTTVTFGGNDATVTSVNPSGTQMTVTTPVGATAGAVDVVVTTPGGSVAQAGGYTYANQPDISSLSPTFGPLAGGTQVTITGTDLTGATNVTFGGVPGTNISVNGDGTQLFVTAPAGIAGAVDVVVTTPGGSSPVNPPDTTYTYVAVPTITEISPSSGPLGGGVPVTISGTGFVNGQTTVIFGGNDGTVTSVNANGTQMIVTAPAGTTVGAVDVVVTTPGGSVTQTGGYTYVNQPDISSLSPTFGPVAGGTQVTITGTDLTGATSVTFGGVSGTNISVNGDGTQLIVTTPAGAAGAVDVIVTTPGGSSDVDPSVTYTYVAVPTITGISPSSGPLGGGVAVTISGTGFVNGQTTVTFGGNDATVASVNPSGTQMIVTTPAGATAGAVDVVVTTPGGSVTQTGGYIYVNQPDITSLSPNIGPLAGGTQVTITGTDLTGATSVTFGSVPGTNINVNGDGTQLTVTTPAGTTGAVQVVVTAPGGSSPINPPATTYTYVAVPTITGISPSSGPLGGGVPVTISGTGFVDGQTTVTFGGNDGTVTSVNANGTQMTVTTPAGTAGAANVTVTTPGGSVIRISGYTYVNQPDISSLSPTFGPLTEGTQVTITGAGFTGATRVTFGSVPGTNISVNGDGTQLTVTTPAGTAGAVQVVVTAPGGLIGLLPPATTYTYVAVPTITGISPSSGPLGGGVPVTISGTGFVNGQTTATFGGNGGTVTSVNANGTQMTVTTPANGTAGAVDVVVTTPGGSVTRTGGYTFVNQPDISNLSPNIGPLIAGTQVTVTGTDLTGATSVTFGSSPGTNISVNGDGTQLTVTAPAGTAGAVQVVVNAPGGSSPLNPPSTTYTYVAPPIINAVFPPSGPVGGGVPVAISGAGFVNGQTTVTFNGNGGTVTSVNANGTQLSVTTPAGTAGNAIVVVTTPGGSVTAPAGSYTYVNQPDITSLSPNIGPLAGGTQVTVTGTDLTGATSVTFGSSPGTNISVNGDGTQLTVSAPAVGTAGAVQVVVTAPGGSSPLNPPASTYTYIAAPTITGISPSSGPLGGGVPVTISGTGFVNGQTTVTFGGNGGTVTNVSSDGTQMTVTTPAGVAAGAVNVAVTTPGGSITQIGGYTYVNQPAISSIYPAFGPVTGGTQMLITGTDLTGATEVTFGGVPGTNINVNGDGTQLFVTIPTAFISAGPVDVVVTTPGGSSEINPDVTTYTYVAPPTVTGISPSSGPLGGGVPVTISGTGFVNGQMTVAFGGNLARVTSVNANGTQMTVTTPANTAGAVNVVVTTPGGSVTRTNGYTYVNQPAISSLSPALGPLTAGKQVTIAGTGFSGATSVTFGGKSGTNVIVNGSGTQLTVNAPAGTAGAVQVVVTAPGGSSPLNPPTTTYTYVAPPTISAVFPPSGPVGGGASVAILGTNFVNGQTTVTFNGNGGTVTNVNANGTQLSVTTPAGTAGAVTVIVTTPGGSVTAPAGSYTYVNQPNITSLSPASGPLAGGTRVTITGTSFTGTTGVTFGGVSGTNISVSSSTQLMVTAPAMSTAGAVQVVVTAPGGSSPLNPPATTFTYVAAPTITGISPTSGPLSGGVPVTISGTGFVNGQTAVTFGGNAGTVTSVNANGTQLTVTTPAGTAGAVNVVVTTPGGSVTQTGGYTYANLPNITSLSPAFGPLTVGTQVTIRGTGFTGTTRVTFGGASVSGNVNSDTQITATAPNGAAGPVAVVVTTPVGSSQINPPTTTYTFVAAPTVTAQFPHQGPMGGGVPVTIYGTGFVSGQTTVRFGGNAGTVTNVSSDGTQMTVTTPAGTGTVDEVITTPGGSVTKTGYYVYNNAPYITSVSPAFGPLAGGTVVTITGANFTGTTSVTFNGPGTNISVNGNGTQLTVTTPASAPSTVSVEVTTPNGSSLGNPPITLYTYVAAPTVTGVSPSSGPVAGGTSVTISGTGFVNGQTTVTFRGNAATVTNVSSDGTQMTVTTPAGTVGAVNVVVTTPGGSVTRTGGYTYI